MPRDSDAMARNVLGGPLQTCSDRPLTGFFRDGCCNTNDEDVGAHFVCVRVTQDFLEFSARRGNDLITPHPEFNFPGLQPGDRWCERRDLRRIWWLDRPCRASSYLHVG